MDSSDYEYDNTCNEIRKIMKIWIIGFPSLFYYFAKCHHIYGQRKNIDL